MNWLFEDENGEVHECRVIHDLVIDFIVKQWAGNLLSACGEARSPVQPLDSILGAEFILRPLPYSCTFPETDNP